MCYSKKKDIVLIEKRFCGNACISLYTMYTAQNVYQIAYLYMKNVYVNLNKYKLR